MPELHYRDIVRVNGEFYEVVETIPRGASHEDGLALFPCDEDGNDCADRETFFIRYGRLCWLRNCEHYDRLPKDKRLIQSRWRVDDLELVRRHNPDDDQPYPISSLTPRADFGESS